MRRFFLITKYFPVLIVIFLLCNELIYTQEYITGESYFDANNYVEYMNGDLPVIISVPHGGYIEPDSIPDRNCNGCFYSIDEWTQELGREIYAAIIEMTGYHPHMVIN